MAERNLPHLIVPWNVEPLGFTTPRSGGSAPEQPFTGDRNAHGRSLISQYEKAAPAAEQTDTEGTYVSFKSFPALQLALESLESRGAGEQPELVAVQEQETDEGIVQVATVYVPHGKRDYLLNKLKRYVETSDEDSVKHRKLIDGIAEIRRATIRELWTDPADEFPEDLNQTTWWEVWLRNNPKATQRVVRFAEERELRTSRQALGFADRTVLLLRATAEQLALGLESLDDLAELRRPHEVASFFSELPALEQKEWVDDLDDRLETAHPDGPAVCVLDTGVQHTHPLLEHSITPNDVHVADPLWKTGPTDSHGTEMAGIALYGDLQEALTTNLGVQLAHRLESVKILPDNGSNHQLLYGALTAQAVDRPEIESPERPRVYLLAITAPNSPRETGSPLTNSVPGRPTSWSAAVDALAYGRAIDDTTHGLTYLDRDEDRKPRLFVVSAGNIRDLKAVDNHLDRSDLSPVEDPAQAWNALTVGAYSPHDNMADAPPGFDGYAPIAKPGELAPFSRTSVLHGSDWPFKPEVVANGGNAATSPAKQHVDTPPNLQVLTTRLTKPGTGYLTTMVPTSPASAQVAAIAAQISAAYPDLQPETVRALVVHSAQWTPAMRARLDAKRGKKAKLAALLRRYGMGVPDTSRAIHSAADSLTLIVEDTLRPFDHEDGRRRANEMKLHPLPWPSEALEALGGADVSLRVTLSYFIEPNPANRGWTGRYEYQSHGLRFAVKREGDSLERFTERINKRARTDTTVLPRQSTDSGWLFGVGQHDKPGSLHTDIWTGPAAVLADRGAIAVHPVRGWWRDRPTWDQSENGVTYSLVVSIEAPELDVDLWTPVATALGVAAEVSTET